MKTTIKLENVNRGCCFSSTFKEIGVLIGVFGVSIDSANSTITIDHTDELSRERLIEKLQRMGYLPVEK